MEVRRPIFIIGAGRSGSTEFHNVLTRHPNVCVRHPARPELNRWVLQALDFPISGKRLDRRLFRGECYDFWDHHCRGFSQPSRDLTARDATQATIDHVPRVLARTLSGKRHRLLVKITGWARTGYVQRIFPDALFIHLLRNGKAVANSLLHADFWRGWSGPPRWQWGALSTEHQDEWECHGRSFVALAGIQWKIMMEAIRQAKAHLPAGRFLEVRYEEMCSQPLEVFRSVAEFCELDWSARFEAGLRSRTFDNRNDKWRRDLTADQQRILQSVVGEELARQGYQTGARLSEVTDSQSRPAIDAQVTGSALRRM
jgi:hypothetical protein